LDKMDSFAFIIHPIDPKRDVSRKYPLLGKVLTERQIDFFSTFFPPVYLSEIEGIQSEATGKCVKGWLIACPYTPRRMLELPVGTVYNKITQCGRLAEKLGAQILGLGAYTSVVGDAGVTIAKALDLPVTTGGGGRRGDGGDRTGVRRAAGRAGGQTMSGRAR
jgi:fatty aldehyde-generating acyl-ACP reductase